MTLGQHSLGPDRTGQFREGRPRAGSVQTVVVPGPRGPGDGGQPAGGPTGDPVTGLAGAVQRAQQGDEESFVLLYRDLQPRLLRYATVLVGRDAAGDVTGEAWFQITRDLHTFTGDIDRFRGWAAKI